MKKTLLIIAVLVAAVAAWINAFPNKNPLKRIFPEKPATAPTGTNSGVQTQKQPVDIGYTAPGAFNPIGINSDHPGFPLQKGSRGLYVMQMQKALNDRYGSTLVVDGIFGPKTYTAVSAHGFNADGVTFREFREITGN